MARGRTPLATFTSAPALSVMATEGPDLRMMRFKRARPASSSPHGAALREGRRHQTDPRAMSNPYIGEIRMFGGNFAPSGWALCQGQLMPIAEYGAVLANRHHLRGAGATPSPCPTSGDESRFTREHPRSPTGPL